MPRRRNRVPVVGFLWTMFFVLLAASLYFSPATALSKVTVVGAQTPYQPYIRNSIKKFVGIPALQISPIAVEGKIQATSAVESASFTRNVFGRAKLIIKYRTPVAQFQSNRELFLDSSGTIFKSLAPTQNLPQIDLYKGGLRSTLTQTGLWPSRRIAWLAKESKKYDFGTASVLEVQASGAVSLITNSRVTIRLGSSYDFENKLKTLDRLIRESPDIWKRAKAINLVVPERPLWTPR